MGGGGGGGDVIPHISADSRGVGRHAPPENFVFYIGFRRNSGWGGIKLEKGNPSVPPSVCNPVKCVSYPGKG